ncbi:MAG: rhomboid family intramembrane serine protease [Luteolibacter sp.]
MSLRPWPRDPRNAGHDGFSTALHFMPVTLLLILACVVVAAVTRLGNPEYMGNADKLYLASQQDRLEYNRLYEEYRTYWDGIESNSNTSDRKAVTAEEERVLEDFTSRLDEIEKRAHDPLADIKKGEVWRLITPIFLHFGPVHILFNMMWLWRFGMLLEVRFRSLRFLGLVLAVAAISNLGQGLWAGPAFGGMSGVNYGLFGFILLRSKYHPNPGFALDGQTVFLMLVWLVACFTGAVGPIANGAHLVGFLSGAALGFGNAMLGGGWSLMKRRREFHSTLSSSANTLHHCAVCGRTERDDPHLEFYVDGEDDQEYCRDHLPKRG